MKKSILLVAAAIGMLAASCNKEILDPQEDLTQTPITISAKYDSNNSKVTYTESGSNITATWDAGDELIVCWNNHKNTLTLSSGAGTSSATFTGTITGTPSANSTLICFVKDKNNPGAVTVSDNGDYLYTSDAFLTQDGSMDSAASRNLYYGTCFYGDGTNISCTFNVNTSMMKFQVYAPEGISEGTTGATLTYKSGSTELAKATFTVGTDGINTIYLTIPAGHYTGEQTLVYHSGDITETETLSSTQANFVAGQTYSRNVYFTNPIATPLTFEAKTAGAIVTFTPASNLNLPIEYSTDGITWTSYSSPVTLANVGDKVSFRGNNATYCYMEIRNGSEWPRSSKFSCSADCYIFGNIMSLINAINYGSTTTMTTDNALAFYELFMDNSNIYNHPSRPIILPATTLANRCYAYMFSGCSSLVESPELPATTLADNCYGGMFSQCSSLTKAPELPATTLANRCYAYMFNSCSSLTEAPELPATTLAPRCYGQMFQACYNLRTAPELPATTLAEECYAQMFYLCTGLSTTPELPATTLAYECYSEMFKQCNQLTTAHNLPATTLSEKCYYQMFYECTNLTTAPELPATTLSTDCYAGMFVRCSNLNTAPELPASSLTQGCYFGMFYGCSNLNYVKCLAIDNISNSSTSTWLYNVASTGTFIKAAGVNWSTGTSGIPSSWTVQEE